MNILRALDRQADIILPNHKGLPRENNNKNALCALTQGAFFLEIF